MNSILNRSELEQYEAAFTAKAAGVARTADKVVSLAREPDVKQLYLAEKHARHLLREIAALRRLEASLSGIKARKAVAP